ncbi:MAG: hypothetical protein V1736_07475 [Pseudomonadota bacterium]
MRKDPAGAGLKQSGRKKPVCDRKGPPKDHDLFQPARRWGFQVACRKEPYPEKSTPAAVFHGTGAGPSRSVVPWHGNLYFEKLGREWNVISSARGLPVVVERRFGNGTIVLCGDPFLLSNEAMSRERHPELLVWLIGKGTRVIFDETHLGVHENPGIALLARKYRLHGFFAGLLLLAGLFVWKNSSSFVPAYGTEGHSVVELSAKRDYAEGLVNLLRRNISPRHLLSISVQEWRKTAGPDQKDMAEKLGRAEIILKEDGAAGAGENAIVERYRAISRILNKRQRLM